MPSDDGAGGAGRLPVGRQTAGVVLALLAALALSTLTRLDVFLGGVLAAAAAVVGYAVLDRRWARTVVRKTGVAGPVWAAGLAAFLAGVATTYAVGDPVPFCERSVGYRGCLEAYGWASVAYLVGCFGLVVAVGHLGRYRRLADVETAPASEVTPGPAAVEGRVDGGETVTAPVSGADAVWYRYARETPRTAGAGYRTRDVDGDVVQFSVADGSGRVLVVPGTLDAHFLADHARSVTVSAEEVPPDVREGDGEEARYREWSLRPEDPVLVAGVAADLDRVTYPVGTGFGTEGRVLAAPLTRADAVASERWRVLVGAAVALLLGVGGFLGMVLAAV